MSTLTVTPGVVATIELHRPDVRNALDEALIGELVAWADRVSGDAATRVAVLCGAGKVFCAGADVDWMRRMGSFTFDENLRDAERAARMLHAIDTLPIGVVGRIHGAAIGGGAGLVSLCDVAIASDDCVFGFTETTIGLVPAMISPYVVRKIGASAARSLFLSGVRFDARRALEIGLVHQVVPAAGLDDAVARQTAAFLRAAPSAVSRAKRLIADVNGRAPADVLALTAQTIAEQRASDDGREGLAAFLEKRAPAWDLNRTPASDPSRR